jgi:tRNA-dihydrouridine synthase
VLDQRFPDINRWMLGRGALGNPFLAEEIKGYPQQTTAQRKLRLYNFHNELYSNYTERLSGPSHLLGRVKHLWLYLIASFPGNEKLLKKILKSNSLPGYRAVVEQLFAT